MAKLLCIYHGNCADGFAAAWVVRRYCSERGLPVEFHAGVYQTPPPDVTGRHVVIVDSSYPGVVLTDMAAVAKSIIIIDHHKTASASLSGFPVPVPVDEWEEMGHNIPAGERAHVAALFDMNRSGAGMTWDYFFPDDMRPSLIDHIEDRDLWRFQIPGTREIIAALFSYPFDFDVWDSFMLPGGCHALLRGGAAIERKLK